jgi:hypothetical protein
MRCVTSAGRTVIMVFNMMIMRPAWPDTPSRIAGRHYTIFKFSIEVN